MLEKTARQPTMSYSEVYQGGEPSWSAYDGSSYGSYETPDNSGQYGSTSCVPARVIERGHVDRKQKTDTFWDRSSNCVNYVVYPAGADDYHRPTSSSYDYNSYGRSATDNYANYGSGTYDYTRRTSTFNDHDPYGRSAAYGYSYSRFPEYSRQYDYSDNYPSPCEDSRHNDHHQYRLYV